MISTNFKLEKWLRHLKSLMKDVVYLKQNNKEFLVLASKWNSKKLDLDLWNFAKRNYVSYISMAIRRLCDNHKDSISLWKIIDDINANATVIKRSWFLQKWPDCERETLFREFFGDSDVLQTEVVTKNLKNLETMTKAIRDRVDRFEAHKDKKQKLDIEPNFNDVDKAVEVICDLYKKYYYLLTQSSLSI